MTDLNEVELKDLWAALEHCLPGYHKEKKEHHWWVWHPSGGPPYRRVSLGKHGNRVRANCYVGHVRSLVRHLAAVSAQTQDAEAKDAARQNVSDCMKSQLPGL